MSQTGIITSRPLFKNTLILRRPRVTNFADVIRITIIFIKATFKDSNKVKGIRNYGFKYTV